MLQERILLLILSFYPYYIPPDATRPNHLQANLFFFPNTFRFLYRHHGIPTALCTLLWELVNPRRIRGPISK